MELHQIVNIRFDLELDYFCCPICQSKLVSSAPGQLYCSNSACHKSKEAFIVVNNKPVLIDFDRSIISESAFTVNAGKSIVQRKRKWLGNTLRLIFQGKSSITKSNVSVLIERMKALPDPKILVVGGGEIGSGLEEFYNIFKNNILAFDIYNSPNVDFIADGHLIPLQTGCLDLVIIQAVLEHVLEPDKVVVECTRVLKTGGIIYAETPFMQQVHEGPFDFTRFTESGHRFLFKDYRLIASGYTSGLGVSLIWSLSAFFTGLFRTKIAGKLARIFFFWLRFFDKIIQSGYHIDGACGVYFMGEKDIKRIPNSEIIHHYQGSQNI